MRVMRRKMIVPRPENKSVVLTGKPVRVGTSRVAPNMAMTCCIPIPIVLGHDSRSSGATTPPGSMRLPSPWTVQPQFQFTSPYYRKTRATNEIGASVRGNWPARLIRPPCHPRTRTGSAVRPVAGAGGHRGRCRNPCSFQQARFLPHAPGPPRRLEKRARGV